MSWYARGPLSLRAGGPLETTLQRSARVLMATLLVVALGGCLGTRVQTPRSPGPSFVTTHPHLIEEYKEMFGRDPKEDFPEWEAGH